MLDFSQIFTFRKELKAGHSNVVLMSLMYCRFTGVTSIFFHLAAMRVHSKTKKRQHKVVANNKQNAVLKEQ